MRRDDVYIGRAKHVHKGGAIEVLDGFFGNPFVVGRHGNRQQVIQKFEDYARARIDYSPEFRDRVRALYGKRLFCYCRPLACHGDVLERLAGELAAQEAMESEGGMLAGST